MQIPLQDAAGAEANPPEVAAFLERCDLVTPQFSQRLYVDTKGLRHCGGGHPIVFEHEA